MSENVWLIEYRLPFNNPKGTWYPDTQFGVFTDKEMAKRTAHYHTEQKNYRKYRAREYKRVEKKS